MHKLQGYINDDFHSGSSAGAGSGDFHVYRGVRRRQYAREKCENAMAEKVMKQKNLAEMTLF